MQILKLITSILFLHFCYSSSAQLSLSVVNITSPTCPNNCDGYAQGVANNGVQPYIYTILPFGVANFNGFYANLCPGTYTASVIDFNSDTASYVFSVIAPPSMLVSVTVIDSGLCYGTGNAQISVTGGVAPYTYSISPNAQIFAGNITGLFNNTYTVTVMDANSCTSTTSFTIFTQLTAPITNFTNVTNVTCNGYSNGSAQANTIGGISPYTYSISPTGIIDPLTGYAFNLAAGIYTVTIADANSCTHSTLLAISQPLQLTNNSNVNNSSCNNCDGSINPITFGGTPPFTYTISGNNFNNLCAGSYTLTTTDSNNCVLNTPITVNQSNYSNLILPNVVTGAGSIVANPTNGVAPYTYSLNGAPFVANNNFDFLCTGTYTLTIKDSYMGGCLKDTIVNVTAANNFPGGNIIPFIVDASCPLTFDGMINVNITPPGAYTYQWSNGGNTNTINNITAGIYTLNVLNAIGECIVNQYTVSAIGNNCGNVTGIVYYDSIDNCSMDIDEYGIPNTMIVANPGNHITFTDAQGNYAINGLGFGNYTISHQNNLVGFYTHCGNNVNVNLNNMNPNQIINFGDSTTTTVDYIVGVNLTNCFVVANPNKTLQLYYRKNSNTLPQYHTGNVYFVLDSINHFNFSVPPHTSISGDTVFWNVSNITFPAYNHILCYLTFPNNYTPLNTFPYTAGIVNTQFPDTILANNIQSSIVPFCNAYDPNNKVVSPSGIDAPGYLDINDPWSKLMRYTINFQNTGNAPAYNIVIEDTISDKLDMSTFEVLHTSHPYQIELINNHIIKWKFYNIMLPDSNTNEPASHGQITYSIKQNPNNTVGDVINNTAYIYFDYNPAIITNQTVNTLYKPSNVKDFTKSKVNVNIYPNPANDIVYIESEEMFNGIIVFDAQMRKVQSMILEKTNSTQINTKPLSNGIYFVKTNNGEMKKLVINR